MAAIMVVYMKIDDPPRIAGCFQTVPALIAKYGGGSSLEEENLIGWKATWT
nr:hypothetical protein [Sphingomonas sp. CDS-1]